MCIVINELRNDYMNQSVNTTHAWVLFSYSYKYFVTHYNVIRSEYGSVFNVG